MSCNKFEKFGLLYFYKELGAQEAQEFEKHLKGCEVCRHKFKELEDTVNLYKELPEEEPSPAILKKILERAKRKKFQLKVLSIEIFQNIPCPTFVPRILWTGAGAMAIIVITGYFFFQNPKPYLGWEIEISGEVELIEEGIYDLSEESYGYEFSEAGIFGDVDKVFLNLENGIGELREKIKNLEKELQSEGVFRF